MYLYSGIVVYRKPRDLDVTDWQRGYKLWLRGVSLSMVGQELGLSPNSGRSVSAYLSRYFGKDATNPIANSFIRSLAEDYPGNSWVEQLDVQAARGSGRFISRATEHSTATKGSAKVTGNRSNEMAYRIAYHDSIAKSYDPYAQYEERPLSLALFALIVNTIVELLSLYIWENMHA